MRVDIPDFSQANVIVVGDVMLDQYWHGDTNRISPEAPVPVVRVQGQDQRPGGAGNVALNLRALGCAVRVFGMVGEDANADLLRAALAKTGASCELYTVPGGETITKLRVIDRNQQLIRLDFEASYSEVDAPQWMQRYEQALVGADAVVLSDYGKGTLQNAHALIDAAKQAGVPVFVDPKGRDFSRYNGATLITPNHKEFELVVGKAGMNDHELVDQGEKLIKQHQLDALLVTLGARGMALLEKDQSVLRLDAHVREVYDVTGAGDTVISVLAACVAVGESLSEAAELANLAAGIVVGKLGAATVSPSELRRNLQRRSNSDLGILSEKRLGITLEDARAHGETIVMTNGCFDILHAGHIRYLRQAKALGHRLLVAVNSDDSVRRLKGKSRPINPLERRMAVLAALRYVDWVVCFDEDTPARLIEFVRPDILVKGGDYRAEELVGYDTVTGYGGKVKILDFVEGCSTSLMIEKMQEEYA